jgi:hypothetical protein
MKNVFYRFISDPLSLKRIVGLMRSSFCVPLITFEVIGIFCEIQGGHATEGNFDPIHPYPRNT